jgi:Rps23 Pro-64 3,4-dihydroxylase Tpa1-like proline 4-hydroxylase
MQDSIKSINDYSWATWRENVDFGYEVQFSRYESSGEDLYGWHVDCGSYDHRTLNWILYLTDDFKGGETEISPDTVLFEEDHETIRKHKACWSLKPEKNTLLIFPSYLVHRVRPSTDGETRKTLNGHIQI